MDLLVASNGKLKLSRQNSHALGKSNQVDIGIRPEHLHLTDLKNKSAAMIGTTTVIEQLGNSTHVYVDTPVDSSRCGEFADRFGHQCRYCD